MNRLEYFRTREDLSQEELARKAGVQQADISRVEKGTRDFKGSEWVNIANVLDCTTDELLGKEG